MDFKPVSDNKFSRRNSNANLNVDYNKILLNIQKMVSSSPALLNYRENFEKNKSSLININLNVKHSINICVIPIK